MDELQKENRYSHHLYLNILIIHNIAPKYAKRFWSHKVAQGFRAMCAKICGYIKVMFGYLQQLLKAISDYQTLNVGIKLLDKLSNSLEENISVFLIE